MLYNCIWLAWSMHYKIEGSDPVKERQSRLQPHLFLIAFPHAQKQRIFVNRTVRPLELKTLSK